MYINHLAVCAFSCMLQCHMKSIVIVLRLANGYGRRGGWQGLPHWGS